MTTPTQRRNCHDHSTSSTVQQPINFVVVGIAIACGLALTSAPAEAQLLQSRVVEWNCPLTGDTVQPTPPADPGPGALVADGNYVWYVTRLVQPRLVRFTPGYPFTEGNATCNWWDLEMGSVQVGGLRLRPVGTTAYIRTFANLQRIETTINRRTTWTDGLLSESDVSIKQHASTAIFTTGAAPPLSNGVPCIEDPLQDPTSCLVNGPFVLQRAIPTTNGTVNITRWEVGGGAGTVYLSGVDGHPLKSNVIYYTEPMDNNVGELTINSNGTASIRRWNLGAADIAISEPRQINVSSGGLVYGITGSGHVYQLNPTTNQILVGLIPGVENQPFGIDAKGLIGFTTSGTFNKVGAWFPDGLLTMITPSVSLQPVTPTTLTVTAPPATIPQLTGPAAPIVKTAEATELPSQGGTFFETHIATGVPDDLGDCPSGVDPILDPDLGLESNPCAPSTGPLGISADPKGGVGSYYAAIGNSVLRLAHVSIPVSAAGIVTGGGWIETTQTVNPLNPLDPPTTLTDKGTFGLVAMRKQAGLPVKGHVTYINHGGNGQVQSLELTDLMFSGNKATIGGLCKTGSDCVDFRVQVEDNGQPSSTTQDTFQIVTGSPLLFGIGPAEGGPLQGGNLKVQQQQ